MEGSMELPNTVLPSPPGTEVTQFDRNVTYPLLALPAAWWASSGKSLRLSGTVSPVEKESVHVRDDWEGPADPLPSVLLCFLPCDLERKLNTRPLFPGS